MTPEQITDVLRQTLDDQRLSRGERQALREVLADAALDAFKRSLVRNAAFDLARDELSAPEAKSVVKWLKDVVNLLEADSTREQRSSVAECHFSPGDACRERIAGLLRDAKRSADICVFSITDNHLARAVVDAHRRGVRIRVISDDDKALDPGSDTDQFREHGIPVAFDDDPSHMHHKFAIFDGRLLATGSYNWTRSAFTENRENILVTDDPRLVAGFRGEFEGLWKKFASDRPHPP